MDESTKSSPCKDCQDIKDDGLHDEVEHLRKSLIERDAHIEAFETEFIKCNRKTRDLEEQVDTWREKYERLYDSHKRVQKLNQGLEDKLLQMVDKMKGEKSQLTRDIATLSVRLAESKHNYSLLQKENERYKNDMNLAIQLLQCKPDHFVSQKLDNLPADTQARVSQYVMSKSRPTSATQSKNGNELETFDASEYEFNISASLMTKILEDSIQDTVTKHCDTCTCSSTQNKPFCYDDTYYSVATQTQSSGEMKNSLCLNCNSDMNSNISAISISPLHSVKLIRDRSPGLAPPMYFIPPKLGNISKDQDNHAEKTTRTELVTAVNKIDDMSKAEPFMQIHKITKIGEDLKHIRKSNGMEMEPAVHHKLCDRTRASISSIKSSTTSAGHEDLLIKDVSTPREIKPKVDNVLSDEVNINLRKNSLSSMGAISRASSFAKSTTSTHRSNTQVGPGPRFCSLRMQAGSKNILLDNAQPDVPPVLYRRQSKCNDNSIFKDLNDIENFVEMEKHDVVPMDFKNDNVVVESTLIDVHVDNNVRDTSVAVKNAPINPILMNVSSSPLQPQKTHNFSNCSEPNNNTAPCGTSLKNAAEIDNLLTEELNLDNNVNKSHDSAKTHDAEGNDIQNKNAVTPNDDRDVKIFNFDRYEQSKLNSQYSRPMRKIDMSQLHSLENTKISKDLPPAGDLPKLTKKAEIAKASLPAIVNVYPNLTQTHLKVNENKRGFTNEQSTSSLSSDDSAAILQKQQLLRVAEWVEQNLEQQNNFNDVTGEDEVNYKATDRENRISRLTETLNELALNMPHPVSKYSKSYTRAQNYSWVNDSTAVHNSRSTKSNPKPVQAVTSTIYPAENDKEDVSTNDAMKIVAASLELGNNLSAAMKGHGSNEISAEELARMEYNVKQFLLSGPQWVTPKASGSRRTSSKTETDV